MSTTPSLAKGPPAMTGIGLTIALVAAGAWAFLIGVADAIREERRQ